MKNQHHSKRSEAPRSSPALKFFSLSLFKIDNEVTQCPRILTATVNHPIAGVIQLATPCLSALQDFGRKLIRFQNARQQKLMDTATKSADAGDYSAVSNHFLVEYGGMWMSRSMSAQTIPMALMSTMLSKSLQI
ncbi:hypothetical protein [Novipirellula caenicola]|uniref:hypothetical protein n=1 Tax=Novipirellula caenicola TaxID=1536901 RepID=UPI0031ED93A5